VAPGQLLLALAVLVGALMAVFQPLSSLMRNQKELRYLITPANCLWSLASVAVADAKAPAARPSRARPSAGRPGPARAWPHAAAAAGGAGGRRNRARRQLGPVGYARQTTPRTGQLPVINFKRGHQLRHQHRGLAALHVRARGPARLRRGRVRGSQSLLHVLARAGVGVTWRDNQSGCKGVCEGLPTQTVMDINPPGLCNDGRCLDEGLLHGLDDACCARPAARSCWCCTAGQPRAVVLPPLPAGLRALQAGLPQDDLRLLQPREIVNAYDNALLYTDHVLAR
jgi:lipid A ethanolaminephosphotransferase